MLHDTLPLVQINSISIILEHIKGFIVLSQSYILTADTSIIRMAGGSIVAQWIGKLTVTLVFHMSNIWSPNCIASDLLLCESTQEGSGDCLKHWSRSPLLEPG